MVSVARFFSIVVAAALGVVPLLTAVPAADELARIWATHRAGCDLDADLQDLREHGVGLVSVSARTVEQAKAALERARRHGMQYHIAVGDVTEMGSFLRARGLKVPDALMIGGVYRGLAMDRHLFRFTARRHTVLIEPPVYNKRFAYTLGSRATGPQAAGDPIGHYFPDMPDPVRAEVVVPLKRFDGKQHLRILPATIEPAAKGDLPENDSVRPDFPASSETANRKLYRLTFDLAGVQGAMLDHVGLAVYWPYRGTNRHWIFGTGTVPAASEIVRQAARAIVRQEIDLWKAANGGTFPSDVVRALRFGDECFYITGGSSTDSPAVNYPLWDFSDDGIASFRRYAGPIEHPRTWGFPEIYGAQAYASWLYTLHHDAAELLKIVRSEIGRVAPGLLLFRNTTRFGVFHKGNDHDGSGPEMLVANSDIVHLDPYPVNASGYTAAIVRDMSYYAGLARRYERLLIPWMQAHTYGGPNGLQHVSPAQVERMMNEQRAQGVDAVMWLGYGEGLTFPSVRRNSWKRAGEMHREFLRTTPRRPHVELAVVRDYRSRAILSFHKDAIRNPSDWFLQQLLEVWAVDQGQPYDVFETPPRLSSAEREALERCLATYSYVVGTMPVRHPRMWVIGEGTEGQEIHPDRAVSLKRAFKTQLRLRFRR